jgi:hypothetical protein
MAELPPAESTVIRHWPLAAVKELPTGKPASVNVSVLGVMPRQLARGYALTHRKRQGTIN